MPRVTTWKVPVALWVLGMITKVALSFFVSDIVDSWVGDFSGFLAMVAGVLFAFSRARSSTTAGAPLIRGPEGWSLTSITRSLGWLGSTAPRTAPRPRGDTSPTAG